MRCRRDIGHDAIRGECGSLPRACSVPLHGVGQSAPLDSITKLEYCGASLRTLPLRSRIGSAVTQDSWGMQWEIGSSWVRGARVRQDAAVVSTAVAEESAMQTQLVSDFRDQIARGEAERQRVVQKLAAVRFAVPAGEKLAIAMCACWSGVCIAVEVFRHALLPNPHSC